MRHEFVTEIRIHRPTTSVHHEIDLIAFVPGKTETHCPSKSHQILFHLSTVTFHPQKKKKNLIRRHTFCVHNKKNSGVSEKKNISILWSTLYRNRKLWCQVSMKNDASRRTSQLHRSFSLKSEMKMKIKSCKMESRLLA